MIPEKTFSRREVLTGLTSAGSVGLLTGAATGAYLNDEEEFRQQQLRTGTLDLELAWRADTGTTRRQEPDQAGRFPTTFGTDPRAAIPAGELAPGDSGEAIIAYRVCGTPANVWLRMEATGGKARGPLATTLEARLWHDDDCDVTTDRGNEIITEGTVAELAAGPLRSGLLLNQCIPDCEPACMGMTWSLPSTRTPAIGGEVLSLEFEFAALQCTHDTTSENP